MNWNEDEINDAQRVLQTVNDAIDAITTKATHLESLMVLLAHTASSEDLPAQHRENVCWLGSELADDIVAAVANLNLSS